VTPHLRSIVPNVQRHMAYFALVALFEHVFRSCGCHRAAEKVLEKGISTATRTHARMQSLRMPLAAYDTLCKAVVRKQRDLWRFFVSAQLLLRRPLLRQTCSKTAWRRLTARPRRGKHTAGPRTTATSRQARPQKPASEGTTRRRAAATSTGGNLWCGMRWTAAPS
jgi:hypothetical protein